FGLGDHVGDGEQLDPGVAGRDPVLLLDVPSGHHVGVAVENGVDGNEAEPAGDEPVPERGVAAPDDVAEDGPPDLDLVGSYLLADPVHQLLGGDLHALDRKSTRLNPVT